MCNSFAKRLSLKCEPLQANNAEKAHQYIYKQAI